MDSLIDFSFDVYRILSSDARANGVSPDVLLSPLSLSMTLLILLYGSRGQTSKEMASVLFPRRQNSFRRRNGSTDKIIFSASEIQRMLHTVNSLSNTSIKSGIFIDTTFGINSDFEQVSKHVFDAKIGSIDFSKGPELSNQLISHIFGAKVKLPEDILSRSTKMILLNRLNAKQNWKFPFDPLRTKMKPFYRQNGALKLTPTMINQLSVDVGSDENLNATLVKLPYEGGARGGVKSYLLLLLPREGTTLQDLIFNLSLEKLQNFCANNLEKSKIKLFLPKFSTNHACSLVYPLQSAGLSGMFESQQANFTGISKSARGLFVGDFIQSNSIEINEVGSKLSSETLVSLKQRSLADEISFNRPFLFLNALIDTESSQIVSILQMGSFSGQKD